MYHSVFLLDYISFRQQAQPLVEMADKGNFSAVLEKAKEIADRIPPEAWILEGLGTSLGELPDLVKNGPVAPLIGFSFLVILSQSLKPIESPRPGSGNVAQVMALLNWNSRDVQLLREGMTTRSLLRPELISDPDILQRIPAPVDDPRWKNPAYYWWYFSPGRAFHNGWWDIELIERLSRQLKGVRVDIQQIDISQLNLSPSVTTQILLEDYDRTVSLFEIALEQQLGLYSITS
jgi:hypothetical protein